MIKTAGRAGGLAAIASAAKHLIAGREVVGDQPVIEGPAASGVTEQLNPMRAPPGVHMIDRQAVGRPTASARHAVVGKHLVAGFLVPAAQPFSPHVRIRPIPAALLLARLLSVCLLPITRSLLDLFAVRLVVAALLLANLLPIGFRPKAFTLSIFHVTIIHDKAEFDDLAQGVRKRMQEIAVLTFEEGLISSLREYWASEHLDELQRSA